MWSYQQLRTRSWRSLTLSFLFILGLLYLPQLALAQDEYARRDYSTPGLIVDTGSPRGACDALLFTPDGKYLLAAGDEKIVRNWQFEKGKLANSDLPTLRWAIYREKRGQIYAVDLDKSSQYVAITGRGIRMEIGAAVIDRFSGKIKHALKAHSRVFASGWSIAFSPSGKQVVLGLDNGSVHLWNLNATGEQSLKLIGQHDLPKNGNGKTNPFNFVKFVKFLNENRVLSIAASGQAILWDVNDPNVSKHSFQFSGSLHQVALSPDRKWLAANVFDAQKSWIEFRAFPFGNETKARLYVPNHNAIQSVAFDGKSERLAIGVRVSDPVSLYLKETDFYINLYDVQAQQGKLLKQIRHNYRIHCLAFHPTANYLAAAGGLDYQVYLWDLNNADPNQTPVASTPSAGKSIWGVTISPKGNHIAFKDNRSSSPVGINQLGKGTPRVFDLEQRTWLPAHSSPSFKPMETAGGWKVLFSVKDPKTGRWKKDIHVWYVQSPKGEIFPLPLTGGREGALNCYTFLPATGKEPVRLAIGHYFGVSIFALDEQKGPERIRLLLGHDAEVTSLAVTPDQKRMITGSTDQTIAGWSLEPWPSGTRLGAFIVQEGGVLVVKKVDAGSPAWEAGLKEGDQIVTVYYKDKYVFNHEPFFIGERLIPKEGNWEAGLTVLQEGTPGESMTIEWKRPGVKDRIYQNTSQIERPVWRFFPAGDSEWVLWRYQDYYYDTSPRGDSFIGWQRTFTAPEKTPIFFRAEQLRKAFHKPDEIALTMKNWTVSPKLISFPNIEPPAVQIPGPALRTAKGAGVEFKLEAQAQGNFQSPNQKLMEAIVWVNDYQLGSWTRQNHPRDFPSDHLFSKTIIIPQHLLRQGKNLVTLQCYNLGNARGESQSITLINKEPASGKPNLFGMFIGVGDYQAAVLEAKDPKTGQVTRSAPGNLRGDEDAFYLAEAWESQEGKAFQKVKTVTLTNVEANRENILGQLDLLIEKVNKGADDRLKPDDLLVFHLAGHGLRADEFPHIPTLPAKMGDYLFVCSDFNSGKIEKTSLGYQEIYERLVKLPCHKLLLLDTCRSGALKPMHSKSHPVRLLTQDGVGPIIIAACGQDEYAYENPDLDFGYAYGLFSIAVRKSIVKPTEFSKADLDGDNKITSRELVTSVETLVKSYVDQMKQRGATIKKEQVPVYYLPQVEETLKLIQK